MKNIDNFEDRANRGGSWFSISTGCRASHCVGLTTDVRYFFLGFRALHRRMR